MQQNKIISRKEAKELGLKRYFPGTACKHGHISERKVHNGECIECTIIYNIKNKDKVLLSKRKYKENNRELLRIKDKEYRGNNQKKEKERWLNWVKNNPEKYKLRNDSYRKNNKASIAKRQREWGVKNPLSTFARKAIRRIENKSSTARYENRLGYTQEQFIKRIEFQFKDGMSWENRSEWHIDHKKPISRFIKQGVTDIKIINALSNLQPLWAKDNIKKSDNWIY